MMYIHISTYIYVYIKYIYIYIHIFWEPIVFPICQIYHIQTGFRNNIQTYFSVKR